MRVLLPPWTDGSAHHCFRSRSNPSSKPGSSCSTLGDSKQQRAVEGLSRLVSVRLVRWQKRPIPEVLEDRAAVIDLPLRQGPGSSTGRSGTSKRRPPRWALVARNLAARFSLDANELRTALVSELAAERERRLACGVTQPVVVVVSRSAARSGQLAPGWRRF